MAGKSADTPLMRQNNQIKSKYPDALLLFRVGDFYETFREDAVQAAKILGIVLTKRNNGGTDVPLAGLAVSRDGHPVRPGSCFEDVGRAFLQLGVVP